MTIQPNKIKKVDLRVKMVECENRNQLIKSFNLSSIVQVIQQELFIFKIQFVKSYCDGQDQLWCMYQNK